ncbi:PIN domain-containing protein [Telmatobacter bradus]|uniref:PIN domain-containing protein n=1 Tax=Telmatobacter bradus TaxID=474953 RepID=UPI003B430856
MATYVLDASALIRFLDNEPGAARVREVLKACVLGQAAVSISAIQWGEVVGNLRKRQGAAEQQRIVSHLLPSEVRIESVNGDAAQRAAELKVDHGLSYADAFALELAQRLPEATLLTADYGFKAVALLARIEFLPTK